MWNRAQLIVNRTDSGGGRVVVLYTGNAGEKLEDHVSAVSPMTTNDAAALSATAIAKIAALNAAAGKVLSEGFDIDLTPVSSVPPSAREVWRALVSRALFAQQLASAGLTPVGDKTADDLKAAALLAFDGAFL